jgi:hypothetical protein
VKLLNAAIAFALGGSILAAAVPAFVRDVHASRFAEPVEGLARIGAAAMAYAEEHPASEAFPAPTPLTPAEVPRGVRAVDPPGTWDAPTWQALAFRPSDEGVGHSYAFSFESTRSPGRSTFVAQAHGDLNGNGIFSTFEVRGRSYADEGKPALEPGMYVEAEVE